jgi:hypothetical protein|tara:strand:+ start:1890 stop:2042 length:153 start_codon:yes stop_codon:yes gene_type:complete
MKKQAKNSVFGVHEMCTFCAPNWYRNVPVLARQELAENAFFKKPLKQKAI